MRIRIKNDCTYVVLSDEDYSLPKEKEADVRMPNVPDCEVERIWLEEQRDGMTYRRGCVYFRAKCGYTTHTNFRIILIRSTPHYTKVERDQMNLPW